MTGAGGVLADEQLLVELLATPEADIFDVDVAFGIVRVAHFEPGEADHGAGEIVDLHRRPHVEHEHLTAARHGAGLDHELGGFRDRHEVTNDFRVGDGQRAACLDLIAEALDHRARRIEHIAEAYHGEHGGAARRGQRLENQLSEPLARAHHIGRTYRLVARHEHEALHACLLGDLGESQRAEGVVLQAGEGIYFDEWHVLVGCGVINHLNAQCADDAGNELAVEHRTEHRYDLGVGKRRSVPLLRLPPFQLLHLHFYLLERDLRELEQNKRLRPKLEQLAGELRADGTTGAGDHHHLVLDVPSQQFKLWRHWIAAEQILDIDRPEIADLHPTGGDFFQRRQGFHHDGEGLERLDRGAALAAERRRHGEQHFLDILLGDHPTDLAWPKHLDAMHHLARERRVVVDEGDHVELAGLVQRSQQLNAHGTGAVDDDVLAFIETDRLVLWRQAQQQGACPLAGEADQA